MLSANLLEARRQCVRLSAELHALGLGRGDALRLPLTDKLPLRLRDVGKNLQNQICYAGRLLEKGV